MCYVLSLYKSYMAGNHLNSNAIVLVSSEESLTPDITIWLSVTIPSRSDPGVRQ